MIANEDELASVLAAPRKHGHTVVVTRDEVSVGHAVAPNRDRGVLETLSEPEKRNVTEVAGAYDVVQHARVVWNRRLPSGAERIHSPKAIE